MNLWKWLTSSNRRESKPPTVIHLVVDGKPVSIGMSSDDFVEMCLDNMSSLPPSERNTTDPYPY